MSSSSSSPRWLPPLNSHDRYTTYVTVEQCKKSRYDPSVPEKLFLIRIDVSVTYYSGDYNQITFPVLFLREEFKVPCHQTESFPLSSLLGSMGVPFQLDHILLSHRCLDMERFSSIEGVERASLDGEIRNILNIVRFHKSYNYQKNIIPIWLMIFKTVEISEREHFAWSSWYEQKKRVDPDFEKKYFAAVSRPRREKELLYEASLTLKAMLEEVTLNDCNSMDDCPICLEELPRGSTVLGLPCSHVFHGDCILKWLQESQNCPLCRFALP